MGGAQHSTTPCQDVRNDCHASGGDGFHEMLMAALPRLRVHATALTRNRPEADDLVHDAVTRALRHRSSFEMGTNFAGWMHRILRNRFISLRRQRREHIHLDDVSGVLDGAGASHEHRLILQELAAMLTDLSSECREALILVAVEGRSYQEVANLQGCAVGTTKTRVFRARQQLKTQLLGHGAGCRRATAAGSANLGLSAP